jgi:DNA mismatch repair protein MSH5
MEHLLSLEDQCPRVLATTHFHGRLTSDNGHANGLELFENGFLSPISRLSFGHMEVRVDIEAAEVENQLVYLYSVQNGRSASTFGSW